MTFLQEFLRDPAAIGAVAPSGVELARLVVSAAELGPGHVVVELGAGTGPMTGEILAQRPNGPFVALEPNPSLAAALRSRFPSVDVAEQLAQELGAVLAARGLGPADRVVSGLPWAIWSAEAQRSALDAVVAAMAPDGRLVTFGYVHSQVLPAAARFRRALRERFAEVSVTRIAWRNVPPAFAFVARRA